MAYGTVNADVIQSSVSGVSLGAGNASIMKNRIINGAMVIDQRNAGASATITSDGQYTLDRWQASMSASSKFSVQQSSTAPAGFVNSLKVTSLAATTVGSTDYYTLNQIVEGYNSADLNWGTANAKTVTFSFWVQSSLTGTFGGIFTNASINRTYPFTYTISSANTWEQKTITIAGDTSGTWGTTNGAGIYIAFGLGVGSSLSGTANAWASAFYRSATGATSVVGTNGATFYITGVQLEVGTSATGFEYRQYQQELALCQRYYEKSYNTDVAVATSTNDGAVIFTGSCDGGGRVYLPITYKVSKRAGPTVTTYTTGGTSGSWGYSRSGASGTGAAGSGWLGTNNFFVDVTTGGTWVAAQVNGHWTSSAEL